MKKLSTVAALVLSMASVSAFAQSESGFYGLASFGFSSVKNTGSGSFDAGSTKIPYTQSGSSAGNSWSLGLGYDIDKTYAVEVAAGSFWKQESKNSTAHRYGTNINDDKTNVLALSLTGLYKHQLTDNSKVFVGPTLVHLRLKGSESYTDTYWNGTGYTTYTESESSKFNKTIPGLVVGMSFALDKKTDLRVSYTRLRSWEESYSKATSRGSDTTTVSNISFGLTSKF